MVFAAEKHYNGLINLIKPDELDIQCALLIAFVSIYFFLAFGLKIEYDGRGQYGRHRANITVTDGDLMGKLCGICGNWNDQAQDDLFPKNSNQQATHFEIGKSWRVGKLLILYYYSLYY